MEYGKATMARIRTIKPEFFTSEQVAECSPTARLLFVGIWCFCDDSGRHPLNFKRLKMEIFPGDSCHDTDVKEWFDELHRAGLVATYQHNGQWYFAVTGWHHQKIEKPTTRYPEPLELKKFDDHSTTGSRDIDDHSATPRVRNGMESNGMESSLRERTFTPCQGELGTVPTTPGTAGVPSADKPTAKSYPDAFEQFWEEYPDRGGRKRGKDKAFKFWKAIPAKDRELLLQATANYAHSGEVSRGYARDPERFLRGNWWRDFLEAASESASRVPTDEDLANWNPVDGGLGRG